MSFPMHKNTKKSDIPLFGQLIDLIPRHILITSIDKYQTDKYCSNYHKCPGFYEIKIIFFIKSRTLMIINKNFSGVIMCFFYGCFSHRRQYAFVV